MGQTKPAVPVPRLLRGPVGRLCALVPGAGALMCRGGNCLSQAPVEAELAAFQLPSSVPLKRRSVSPGGGGGLRGGRFEVAVVGQCQPKITMGRWGGWNPGGQPLTWLAALVSPVL
jgi:hypothetical protein